MMKIGAQMIADERDRQITSEGWTSQHDDLHANGAITSAAISYALTGLYPEDTDGAKAMLDKARKYYWPWHVKWWKPRDRISNLVRAGALIAAEIDRIQRGKNDL